MGEFLMFEAIGFGVLCLCIWGECAGVWKADDDWTVM